MMLDIDQAVHTAFNNHTVPGYGPLFYGITLMGSVYLWIAVLLIYLLIGRWKTIAAVLIITLAFGMVVNDDIKDIVQRQRPDNVMVGSYFSHLNYSFPSGHTETAFIIATVLSAFVAWRYRLVLYLLASAVGLSRLYLGVHYATDVAGGAAAGVLLGIMAIFALYRLGLCEGEGMYCKVHRWTTNSAGKGLHDDGMIKYAAVTLAAGYITAIVSLLLSQYILSLTMIGVTYILLLLLPSLLKGRLHGNIH
jgi:membrane-associated phospholipid phosphatase